MENDKVTFTDPEYYLFGLDLNLKQINELGKIKEWGAKFNAMSRIKEFHKSLSAQQILEEA
jgi:hypothetical protein